MNKDYVMRFFFFFLSNFYFTRYICNKTIARMTARFNEQIFKSDMANFFSIYIPIFFLEGGGGTLVPSRYSLAEFPSG